MSPLALTDAVVARETTVRLRDNVMGMLGLGPPRRPSNVLPWYHLVPGGIKSFGIYLAGRDGGKLTIGCVSSYFTESEDRTDV